MTIYAAYNKYGDLIADGASYESCGKAAHAKGYFDDEFFIVRVSA